MNPLESRKKLLLAESELNRAQLVQDWRTMTYEVHSLTHRARTVTTFASAAAALVANLTSFWRKKSAPVAEKPSWLRTILKGAGTVTTLWSAFRARGHEQKDK